MVSQFTSNQERRNKKNGNGSTTVPATLSKSGGARNDSSSPDVTAARLAAVSELSVSFEDEEGMVRTPKMITMIMKTDAGFRARRCGLRTATLSHFRGNLAAELDDVAGPDQDYDDFNDGTEGSKPSLPSAFFDRVEALMKNDEWMQLFKPIPKKRPTGRLSPTSCNTLSTQFRRAKSRRTRVSLLLALGYENETHPSTMSRQDWNPHEAGAALQKWKKAFGAIGLTKGSNQKVRQGSASADHPRGSSVLLRLSVEPTAMPLALPTLRPTFKTPHGDATLNKPYATSWTPMTRVHEGRRGGARASRNGLGTSSDKCRRSSSDDDDLLCPTYEDEDLKPS
ncbi:hypothetical protein GQ600_90 [Phytophthora cactorum]|nr:hypothetical protein GQ600_90 [Phytophthora cactorum]